MRRAAVRQDNHNVLRGHLAFLIADTPAHRDRSLDELLAIVDAVLTEFVVYKRTRLTPRDPIDGA